VGPNKGHFGAEKKVCLGLQHTKEKLYSFFCEREKHWWLEIFPRQPVHALVWGKTNECGFFVCKGSFHHCGIIELGLSHLKDWDGRSRDISFQTLFQPERAFVCLA